MNCKTSEELCCVPDSMPDVNEVADDNNPKRKHNNQMQSESSIGHLLPCVSPLECKRKYSLNAKHISMYGVLPGCGRIQVRCIQIIAHETEEAIKFMSAVDKVASIKRRLSFPILRSTNRTLISDSIHMSKPFRANDESLHKTDSEVDIRKNFVPLKMKSTKQIVSQEDLRQRLKLPVLKANKTVGFKGISAVVSRIIP